jgi:hypothetical protein
MLPFENIDFEGKLTHLQKYSSTIQHNQITYREETTTTAHTKIPKSNEE